MWRFEEPERNRYENSWTYNGKTFVKCTGPGPRHSTKSGSPNLVVGLHWFREIEKGIYHCKNCYRPTIIRESYRPSYVSKLTPQEAKELGERLSELRKAYEIMETRIPNKVDEGLREPTSRQRKL